jgi:predicted lipoprotein with Yx(FWY)xxD motif
MSSRRRTRRTLNLVAIAVAGLALLAACGNDDPEPTAAPAAADDDKTPTTIAAEDNAVSIGETDLGQVLVDADGRTLYAFLADAPGTSNCNGPCATNWPPLLVDPNFAVGLSDAGFGTTARQDGTTQLTIDQRPLYRFAGDQQPGDTNGQGSNGKWFVVDSSGRLIDGTEVADVTSGQTGLGEVLTDGDGRTLYAFLADTDGTSTCNGLCATNWPPLTIEGNIHVADGPTAQFGTTVRADGAVQATVAGHPLYRFAADAAPGDTNGQGINGKWFVVDTAGNLIGAGA